jgi:hypothetical protein
MVEVRDFLHERKGGEVVEHRSVVERALELIGFARRLHEGDEELVKRRELLRDGGRGFDGGRQGVALHGDFDLVAQQPVRTMSHTQI